MAKLLSDNKEVKHLLNEQDTVDQLGRAVPPSGDIAHDAPGTQVGSFAILDQCLANSWGPVNFLGKLSKLKCE